ncbi:hypothetical protein IFM89_037107 [Coptis chinensis]|uniref:MIF4G domain-containing protein n=1 Tax=Coptis chinensis TaxID=261450 RepID=A0A835LPU4_9MAGN|nr:hypothetical protein IFM89_037107 [Coptis chinensis]
MVYSSLSMERSQGHGVPIIAVSDPPFSIYSPGGNIICIYIRKLLFTDLDKSSIEHILRQLRKLPWNECEPYLIKCFMKVHKEKYSQVHVIASLTAGLSRYHDEFAVAIVDKENRKLFLGHNFLPSVLLGDSWAHRMAAEVETSSVGQPI